MTCAQWRTLPYSWRGRGTASGGVPLRLFRERASDRKDVIAEMNFFPRSRFTLGTLDTPQNPQKTQNSGRVSGAWTRVLRSTVASSPPRNGTRCNCVHSKSVPQTRYITVWLHRVLCLAELPTNRGGELVLRVIGFLNREGQRRSACSV